MVWGGEGVNRGGVWPMGREGSESVMEIEYVVVSSFLSCQIWNERSYSKDYIVVSLLVCTQ